MTEDGYTFEPDDDPEEEDELAGEEPSDESSQKGDEAKDAKPKPFFGSEDEFVRKHLRYHYRRTVGRPNRANFRWQAAWWRSEEAGARIEALWRAWEEARLNPGSGMSDWWITHCDRQMSVLLSTDGPYALSQDENKPGEPLPYTAPKEGTFPKDRQPDEDT